MIKAWTNYGSGTQASRDNLQLHTFKGVDMTSGAASVDKTRSPSAPNMMPDANGFPVKRPGYIGDRFYADGGKTNGVYRMQKNGEQITVVHSGTHLYCGTKKLSLDMADHMSSAVEYGGKLWILDGSHYYVLKPTEKVNGVWQFEAGNVQDEATVPVINIAKSPSQEGSATSYNPFNLMSDFQREDFYGTETDTEYYTAYPPAPTSFGAVEVEILDTDGNWQKMTEGNGFSVNRTIGYIKFTKAPGKSPIEGEDNVRITYPYDRSENRNKVLKNHLCILYGVSGGMDRIFMAGNPDEPNVDRWSWYQDPSYIGDTFFGVQGSTSSPIMGYSVLNDHLVTHKAYEENDRNAFVRYGQIDNEGNALFPITNVIQGDGAASNRGYATLSSEPVFISKRGIFALTASDITGERYNQKRSFFIDGSLKYEDMSKACGCMWGRFYVLSTGANIYLLDTDQRSYEARAQASNYQYECYYWPNIEATEVWTENDELYWGDNTGHVYKLQPNADASRFYQDCKYNDQGVVPMDDYGNPIGVPVEAYWSTPLLELGSFGRKKTVEDVFVTMQPYGRTGCKVYYASNTFYERLAREWNGGIFSWDDIDFNRWTWDTLQQPEQVRTAAKAYGVNLFQVRVENTEAEAFGIYAIQIDYSTGNKVIVR